MEPWPVGDIIKDNTMKRRDFLMTQAAALAQPAPPKARMTTSVMLWTLKGSFDEKLDIAARTGLQSVELVAEHVNWTDPEVDRMKKRARSYNIGMDTIIATPDWSKRPVSMVDASQRDNFLADV